MSWLSKFLGFQNPAQSAMPYYDQAAQTERQYLDPYVQRGQQAGGILSEQFGQLSQDPGAALEKLMQGYQPSKYYQTMQDRLSQATANTAAAGGRRGSPLEQTQQQELTSSLLSKDMQDYLRNVMGEQQMGLSGEQGLYSTGFDAARGLSGDLANILSTQGSLQFQNARERNARTQGLIGALFGSAFGGGQGGGQGANASSFFNMGGG